MEVTGSGGSVRRTGGSGAEGSRRSTGSVGSRPGAPEGVGAAHLRGGEAPRPLSPDWNDPTTLSDLQKTEVALRLAAHGLNPDEVRDVLAVLGARELESARKHSGVIGVDPTAAITAADMERAVELQCDAMRMQPVPQSVLCGLTHVLDLDFALSPEQLHQLAQAAVDAAGGNRELLLAAINKKPAVGEINTRPQNPIQLVASIYRQIFGNGDLSKKLALTPKLEIWLRSQLPESATNEDNAVMGGAAPFLANAFGALGVESAYFSDEKLPAAIAERLGENVRVVGADGEKHEPLQHVSDDRARMNHPGQYLAHTAYTLFGEKKVRINGKNEQLTTGEKGRVILGGDSPPIRFGDRRPKELTGVADETDLLLVAGHQHVTNVGADNVAAHIKLLVDQTQLFKDRGTYVHVQYTPPKDAAFEKQVYDALKGSINSFDFNAEEVKDFLNNMLGKWAPSTEVFGSAGLEVAQHPAVMIEGAEKALETMELDRVQLHGRFGDVLVYKDNQRSPLRQLLALLRARQIGSMKAANPSKEVKDAQKDLRQIIPVPEGKSLATLPLFVQAIADKFGLTPDEAREVRENWWYQDPKSDLTYVYAPARGLHDTIGGTVSLGDTFGGCSVLFGRENPDSLYGSVINS